jgi:hypothetical protein
LTKSGVGNSSGGVAVAGAESEASAAAWLAAASAGSRSSSSSAHVAGIGHAVALCDTTNKKKHNCEDENSFLTHF